MNICIFGASSDRLDACYLEAAQELGLLLAAGGHRLIFGGGMTGVMGACARGAAEGGGEIVGIAPRFFDEPGILYPDCTEFIYTETMAERKTAMEDMADAFITLPGGIGTFEEFFEVLTLRQLGRHDKPIVLLNTAGYYDALAAMLDRAVEGGFMSADVLSLCALCRTPAEALQRALTEPPRSGSVRRIVDYNK